MMNSATASPPLMGRIGRRLKLAWQRDVCRDAFLLAIKRWVKDRGDATLRLDYPLNERSVVLDLGGFHGDFAADIHERYRSTVYLFEPVPSFYDMCTQRFLKTPDIHCLMYGLSSKNGTFQISNVGDASSFLVTPTHAETLNAELRSLPEAWSELGLDAVDLIKINIEGGEFDVLQSLLDSQLIKKVKYIQVQFHNFIPGAKEKRDLLRQRMAATHTEMWNYEFVWESWRLN